MRVLLIDLVNRPEEVNEPLGLGVLAGALGARFGQAVECRQELWRQPTDGARLSALLADWQPSLLGLSSKIGALEPLLALYRAARGAREVAPAIVIGDQLATLASEPLLEVAPEALCVRGEGEEALGELVAAAMASGSTGPAWRQALLAREVPNLALLEGGARRATPGRVVQELGAAPPARAFVRQALAEGWIIHAEASRGCPWGRCSFCYVAQKYHGQPAWRPLPIAAVLADLERLSQAGARTVFFTDEDFVGPDWERLHALCAAIVAAKQQGRLAPELGFFISASVRTLLGHQAQRPEAGGAPAILAALAAAGVRELFLGLESGCDSQLQRYRKGVSAADNLRAVGWVRASGIELDLGFLPFDPWTSLEELAANLAFARAAGLVDQPVRILKPVLLTPGTPLAQDWARQSPAAVQLDALTLTPGFTDERVARIAALVSARWEARRGPIYSAQAARRARLGPGGAALDALGAGLRRERADDFAFIERCVAVAAGVDWRAALDALAASDPVLAGRQR